MQNVGGVFSNIQNVNKTEVQSAKSKNDTQQTGANFMEAVSQAVKLGKLVVPTRAGAVEVNFEKTKVVNFNDIRWDDEEEQIEQLIGKIKKVIDNLHSE